MIQIVKGDRAARQACLRAIAARGAENNRNAEAAVSEILKNVRERGDAALREYTEKFDGVRLETLELPKEALDAAERECDPALLDVMRRAAKNIRAFHERQKQQSRIDPAPNGTLMGQRVRALKRVGVYVPGGTAPLSSSILMNVLPAKIAGVGEIVMATPPGKTGLPDQTLLAAAKLAGVDRVFLIGGAQAVAALAYGTESVPKVDKVVGPGNIFVATAKRMLFGTIDIDMVAGPSEIAVIADGTARADFLAADLLGQAEHDKLASSVLLTPNEALAESVAAEVERQMAGLSRKEILRESIDKCGAILVTEDMDEAVALVNELAPEHLEVCAENPMEYLGKLDNAGSVFLGHYTPEPLGDYWAGPNHVLPTGGTARFFSPLSVDDFIKKSSFIYYTKDALLEAAPDVIRFAEAERLTAHANALKVRQAAEEA